MAYSRIRWIWLLGDSHSVEFGHHNHDAVLLALLYRVESRAQSDLVRVFSGVVHAISNVGVGQIACACSVHNGIRTVEEFYHSGYGVHVESE